MIHPAERRDKAAGGRFLFRCEKLLRGQQIVALRGRGFRPPAGVPRAEQELLHLVNPGVGAAFSA